VKGIRNLTDLPREKLTGRRVLVRVDFNVPLDGEGGITDPGRIDAALPTLRHLLEAGAALLLVSHLGRPGKGERDEAFSLAPVARLLSDRLDLPVSLLSETPGSDALEAAAAKIEPGQVALLENIRYSEGETRNDRELALALAGLAEVFVSDAFGVAHRAHASNVGAAEVILERGDPAVAGFLVEREVRFLAERLADPEHPFIGIMGGAKISGKIDVIEAILPRVDRLLVGGAMANTFFVGMGLAVGQSLIEPDRVQLSRELLDRAGEKLLLPVDCIVAPELSEQATARIADRTEIADHERIGDIGPRTRQIFLREISTARTIVWNGPMGVSELDAFAAGTLDIARGVADAADVGALAIVGGGDSAAAAEAAGVASRMSHVSTGGGASLELLAGKDLPGIRVLRDPAGVATS
jgi:phosphoglycerate kinase